MGLTEAFYEFFIELSANNQKSWFDENRARYEREVKALFLTFVESVLVKMAAAEQSLLYNKQFYIQHAMDAEDGSLRHVGTRLVSCVCFNPINY